MILVALVLSGGLGLGVFLVALGLRGVDAEERPRRLPLRLAPTRDQLLLRVGLAVLIGVAAGAATRWPMAAVFAAGAGAALPSLLEGRRAQRAAIARTEAVAAWTDMLRDMFSAGAGLERAIVRSASVAPLPIRVQVVALADAIESGGQSTDAALVAFARAVANPAADLVVAGLRMVAGEEGARVGELLGAVASSARAEAAMYLEVDADRAESRTTMLVVTLTTVAMVGFLAVFSHDFVAPIDSLWPGQLVLGVACSLFLLGFLWMARLARPARPHRLFVEEA